MFGNRTPAPVPSRAGQGALLIHRHQRRDPRHLLQRADPSTEAALSLIVSDFRLRRGRLAKRVGVEMHEIFKPVSQFFALKPNLQHDRRRKKQTSSNPEKI